MLFRGCTIELFVPLRGGAKLESKCRAEAGQSSRGHLFHACETQQRGAKPN